MSDDANKSGSRKPAARARPLPREAERAEALRANLMRRKVQARGRTDAADDPEAKKPGKA
jgi:hypothetical protein